MKLGKFVVCHPAVTVNDNYSMQGNYLHHRWRHHVPRRGNISVIFPFQQRGKTAVLGQKRTDVDETETLYSTGTWTTFSSGLCSNLVSAVDTIFVDFSLQARPGCEPREVGPRPFLGIQIHWHPVSDGLSLMSPLEDRFVNIQTLGRKLLSQG